MVVKVHTTLDDHQQDRIHDRPYARFNLDTELNLTTEWQRLVFDWTSQFNANLFPTGLLTWDSTNNKFVFDRDNIWLYDLVVTFEIEWGFRPTEIDMRFTIPTTTPIHFPLPDTQGFHTLTKIERRNNQSAVHVQPIRTTQILIDNWLGIDLKADKVLVARPTKLKHCILEVYPK